MTTRAAYILDVTRKRAISAIHVAASVPAGPPVPLQPVQPASFEDVLEQVSALLLQHGRVSYGGLKRRFGIDDSYIDDIKAELIDCRQSAHDEDGRVLVRGPGHAGVSALEQPAANPERRQLTILFCDLVSSTELSTRFDPEDFREVMLRYHEACAQTVVQYGGHVAQYLGDGLQVYFGYPQAHDDSVVRALHASLAILKRLRELNRAADDAHPCLSVRIGVHTGLVVVGEIGGSGEHRERLALGEAPNIAARVQALAATNSVVISGATRRLIGDQFRLESLGEHLLRGIAQPLELFRVCEAQANSGLPPHKPTRIVGRDADLSLLQARFDAATSGNGQIVAVSGEPGIGKSCLIRAFRARITDVASQWECRCSAFHVNTALHPVVQLLRSVFQIDEREEPNVALAKLRAGLAKAHQPEESVATFATLLACGGEETLRNPGLQRRRTIELLTSFLLDQAEQRPVLLTIEDLHWADPSSLELLGTLAMQARARRVLIVVSHRTGFAASWAASEQITTLTLDKLTRADATLLLHEVTDGMALPASVTQTLLGKTDGIPLFIEELARIVLEPAAIGGDRGQAAFTQALPSTIHDSLMARLDQLGPAREVAQIGSVLGRSFSHELLAAVWPSGEAALTESLASSVRSGLLQQRGFPPEATYTFKHALVQEAAYETMLRRDRRANHERVARAICTGLPQLAQSQPEVVARHLTEARLFGEALEYWQLAAEKSLTMAANFESVHQLNMALQMLQELPASAQRDQREVSLLVMLRAPLIATQGFASPELARVCQRARGLCSQLTAPLARWEILFGLYYQYEVSGAPTLAAPLLAELEELAAQCDARDVELQMCVVRGHCLYRGKLAEARAYFERVATLYDPELHGDHALRFGLDPLVVALAYLNHIVALQDEPQLAPDLGERAIAHARQIGHAHSLAFALQFAASCAQMRGARGRLRAYTDEAIALSTEHGFVFWLTQCRIMRCWLDAMEGCTQSPSELERAVDDYEAIGARLFRTFHLAMLAEVYLDAGEIDRGIDAIARAQPLMELDGERLYEAELTRLLGELHVAKQTRDATFAHDCFVHAVELARAQGAVLLEIKACSSLQVLRTSAPVALRESAEREVLPVSLLKLG